MRQDNTMSRYLLSWTLRITSHSSFCFRMLFMTPVKPANNLASSPAASFFLVFLLLFSTPEAATNIAQYDVLHLWWHLSVTKHGVGKDLRGSWGPLSAPSLSSWDTEDFWLHLLRSLSSQRWVLSNREEVSRKPLEGRDQPFCSWVVVLGQPITGPITGN